MRAQGWGEGSERKDGGRDPGAWMGAGMRLGKSAQVGGWGAGMAGAATCGQRAHRSSTRPPLGGGWTMMMWPRLVNSGDAARAGESDVVRELVGVRAGKRGWQAWLASVAGKRGWKASARLRMSAHVG
jgi:hypothetical protein